MAEDDYPNFGNAWGTTAEGSQDEEPSTGTAAAPTASSLSSAQNGLGASHAHGKKLSVASDADFFERYPGPTPEKSRTGPAERDGEDASPTRKPTLTAQADDSESSASAGGAVQPVQDHEAALFTPGDDAEHQKLKLEAEMPDADASDATEPTKQNLSAKNVGTDPSSAYEHQGETTEMEEAVEDAPTAPLMKDPEAPPTVEEKSAATRSPTDLDSEMRGGPVQHLDRSFTTNFTEAPPAEDDEEEEALQDNGEGNSDGWPAVGDDKTFGELLDDEQKPSSAMKEAAPENTADDGWGDAGTDDAFGELLGKEAEPASANTEAGKNDEDVAALWEAALDDDGLLDESNDIDPSAFFGDDDEGFLEDEFLDEQAAPSAAMNGQAAESNMAANFGAGHGRSSGTPSTGLTDIYNAQSTQRPSAINSQSFSDKAKGGYQSPYDLPMDVVKPRQRPRPTPQSSAPTSSPVPPPRTSSFSGPPGQPSFPQPGSGTPPPGSSGASANAPPRPPPKNDEGFFADLPVAPKPRSRPSGAYTPQPQASQPPSLGPPAQFPQQTRSVSPSAAQSPPVPVYGGLAQPDRLPLLPEQPNYSNPPPQTISASPPTSRYSPNSMRAAAPAQNKFSPAPSQTPPASSRYSPAPNPQKRQASVGSVPGIQQAHAFLPRTSSPLAFQSDRQPSQSGLPGSPPKSMGLRSPGTPDRSVNARYSPMDTSAHAAAPSFSAIGSPPQRPRTQSPPTVMKTPKYSAPSFNQTGPPAVRRSSTLPPRQQYSRELNFVAPNDERAHDPLERWKGHPIFKWGASGALVSTFPIQTPFYSAGQSAPSMKCSPGSISLQDASTIVPLNERNSKFPGPLAARAKGKKKDVLAWMTNKIEELEREAQSAQLDFQLETDLKKRAEEKLVLWKIVKVFVEHDGSLDSNPKLTEVVRGILLPNLAEMKSSMELHSPQASVSTTQAPTTVDRQTIMELRQALLEGERERAVWLAEEKKLWGHAMLIASTMGQETWKQIIQSFVRSQVQSVGSDARSLAALYQVFAGNSDECVDELVPSSARAGFQMISKVDGTATGNPLEGLDQWRETLGLVVGNRTPNDGPSLISLGKLLASYGRAEAAHTCYLFARHVAKHGGADDPETHFVLLGSNHQGQDAILPGNDLDSVILTEIYEWASSLSAPASAVHYVPHLQAFKLVHAQTLATHGLKNQAQSYCDHITAALKATTRPSPYYHTTFTQSVDDLSAFLSQTPQTGSQGYLSKTVMNKFSSGAASWLTKSLLGDDEGENTGNNGSGSDDTSGPFGRVNGDSPAISRTVSTTELYNPMASMPNSYNGGSMPPPQHFQSAPAAGKYAPGGGSSRYAPSATGSFGGSSGAPAPRGYTSAPSAHGTPRSDISASSDPGHPYSSDSRRSSNHEQSAYGMGTFGYQPQIPEQPVAEEQETRNAFAQPHGLGLQNDSNTGFQDGGYAPPTSSGYEPPSGGYEPPSYQPYEPEPEQPEEDESAPKPKKSFMDDEDDDDEELVKRAAAMKKAQEDRAADEAFRKAAEADAQRDKAKKSEKRNSGWLGGWFKKDGDAAQQGPIRAKLGEENSFYYDENLKKWVNKKAGADSAAPVAATPPPPRGPSSRAPSAAGGPPSGPPSRVASGGYANRPGTAGSGPPGSSMGTPAFGPGSGPPSRSGTPASSISGIPLPPAVAALNPSAEGGHLAATPPLRPSTTASDASSLDDLLGGPPGPGRKAAGGAKGKKKGRGYVDVMAK